MNPDRFPDAAGGRGDMRDSRRDLGMEGESGRKPESPSSAMRSLEEAFRD